MFLSRRRTFYYRSGIFRLFEIIGSSIIPVREYLMGLAVSDTNILPYGKILSVDDIGRLVRSHRKSQSATQADFAALCGVGVRFISELENGKTTIELGKALQVLKSLGLEVYIQPRDWKRSGIDVNEAKG